MSSRTTTMHPSVVMATGVPCLDVAGLAALLGCARHHVVHRLAPQPGFPRPVIHISCTVRYWRSSDVLQWLHRPGGRAMSLADLDAPRLNTAGIAALLGCTRQHAADNVTKRVDFPPPCINVSNRMRSWLYRDVLAWLNPQGALDASRDEAIGHGILDADGLAQWLGCTRKHLSQSLLMRPDFPPPFLYASRRMRWWRASDVQAWCKDKGMAAEFAAPLARAHAVEGG